MYLLAAYLAVFLTLWLIVYFIGPLVERALAAAAHFTTKFRIHDYLPVFVVLAIGIGLTMAAGDAFLDIAEELHHDSPELHRIDRDVHDWAIDLRTPLATKFLTALTILGTPVGMGVLV